MDTSNIIEALHADVLRGVLSWLPVRDLGAFSGTCRAARHYVTRGSDAAFLLHGKTVSVSRNDMVADTLGGWPCTRSFSCLSGNLGYSGVHALAKASVQSISLYGCKYVGNDGLAMLAESSTLEVFRMGQTSTITSFGYAALAQSRSLRDVELTECYGLGDGGLVALASAPALERLCLVECHHVTDTGVCGLVLSRSLRHVGLIQCRDVTFAAARMVECPAVKVSFTPYVIAEVD